MSASKLYVIYCDGEVPYITGGLGRCLCSFDSRLEHVDDARREAKHVGWSVETTPATKQQRSPASRSIDLCPGCTAKRAAAKLEVSAAQACRLAHQAMLAELGGAATTVARAAIGEVA